MTQIQQREQKPQLRFQNYASFFNLVLTARPCILRVSKYWPSYSTHKAGTSFPLVFVWLFYVWHECEIQTIRLHLELLDTFTQCCIDLIISRFCSNISFVNLKNSEVFQNLKTSSRTILLFENANINDDLQWQTSHMFSTKHSWDFPGGPVVKNPPSNAGNARSIPGWGTKIPHAAGQLSPSVSTREAACLELQGPRALEPKHRNQREKTRTPQLERSPCTTTNSSRNATKVLHAAMEIPRATTTTPHSQKLKNKIK